MVEESASGSSEEDTEDNRLVTVSGLLEPRLATDGHRCAMHSDGRGSGVSRPPVVAFRLDCAWSPRRWETVLRQPRDSRLQIRPYVSFVQLYQERQL